MDKIATAVQQLEWRIEFAEEEIESRKKAIGRELERFSVTSGQWLAQYGRDIEEAQKEIRRLREQIKMLEYLREEDK